MAITNEVPTVQEKFEGFTKGGHNLEEVSTYVEKTFLRDDKDSILGLVSRLNEDGSITLTTQDGVSYSIDKEGEVTPFEEGSPELHEAQIIPEETITLEDGMTISYANIPVTRLFGGIIISGQPIISKIPMNVGSWLGLGAPAEPLDMGNELLSLVPFAEQDVGKQGGFQYYRNQVVGYRLYKPLQPEDNAELGILTPNNCPISFENLRYVTRVEFPNTT